jgi:NAD(P)-dependent dehydrogenase (short-subunit alcohol dehydrogenase family)
VVTRWLHSVIGDEPLQSNEATVLGACKVISQEYPHLRCRNIDIAPSDQGIADALVREMTTEEFGAVVAYRRGRRWLEEYEPVHLEPPTGRTPLLADGGVYLITGGLGNIPMLLAEAIADEYKVRFLLTGRSQFPPRERWDDHLAQSPNDPTSAKIRRLLSLERRGCEVAVVQADVTDSDQMRAAVERAVDRWGALNGVIHGAANLSPDAFVPVSSVDRRAGDGHFGPKAHGLLVLDEVLRGQPLEFCFLLSSLSAVLGGLNLACYAASNAYLDAAARHRNDRGTTQWITVDWDAWTFAPRRPHEEAVGPSEGHDCFRRILASNLRHVVVSTTPLADRLARWVELRTPAPQRASVSSAGGVDGNGASPGPTGTGELHSRPDLSTQYAAPSTDAERSIAAVWEQLLGVTPIGRHDKFFELGGHSLLAIQVLTRLREIFDLDLQVQRIFEAPTVAELAASIERDRADDGGTGQATDDSEMHELLSLVESLSEEELEALLEEAGTSEGDGTPHG